jgi:hypothetical protein
MTEQDPIVTRSGRHRKGSQNKDGRGRHRPTPPIDEENPSQALNLSDLDLQKRYGTITKPNVSFVIEDDTVGTKTIASGTQSVSTSQNVSRNESNSASAPHSTPVNRDSVTKHINTKTDEAILLTTSAILPDNTPMPASNEIPHHTEHEKASDPTSAGQHAVIDTSPLRNADDANILHHSRLQSKLTSLLDATQNAASELIKDFGSLRSNDSDSGDDYSSAEDDIDPDPEADNKANKTVVTLESLNASISGLSNSLKKLSDKVSKIKESRTKEIEKRIAKSEKCLLSKQAALTKDLTTRISEVNDEVKKVKAQTDANTTEFEKLKCRINQQQATIDAQNAEMATMKEQLGNGDTQARQEARQALEWCNAIESHNRRWAFRIMGISEPEEYESTEYAKLIVSDFVREELKIPHFSYENIDCAHRVGRVRDGKQAMLVRLHERDHVDLILSKRATLKDSGFTVLEDSTMKTRRHHTLVKKHPLVETAWIFNGSVWAVKKTGGRKIKINIFDNIDAVLA